MDLDASSKLNKTVARVSLLEGFFATGGLNLPDYLCYSAASEGAYVSVLIIFLGKRAKVPFVECL